MSEQFIQAWAVDLSKVGAAIGSKDTALLAKLVEQDLADDLREVFEDDDEAELEVILGELIAGKPKSAAPYTFRRALALFADLHGKRVDDEEVTLPGRGWQDLAPAWEHWKCPAIAALWSTEPAFANTRGIKTPWPRILLAAPAAHPKLAAEGTKLTEATIEKLGVPPGIDRFSDGEWPLDELAPIVVEAARAIASWARPAKKRSLLLWLDGQQ